MLYRNTSKTHSNHSEQNSSSWLLAIKTPAIASDLTVTTKSVSYQVDFVIIDCSIYMSLYDEQLNYLTSLIIKPCPPGHVLHITDSNDEYECRCDDNNVNIVECAPNQNKIILEVCSSTQYIQCTVATTMH